MKEEKLSFKESSKLFWWVLKTTAFVVSPWMAILFVFLAIFCFGRVADPRIDTSIAEPIINIFFAVFFTALWLYDKFFRKGG